MVQSKFNMLAIKMDEIINLGLVMQYEQVQEVAEQAQEIAEQVQEVAEQAEEVAEQAEEVAEQAEEVAQLKKKKKKKKKKNEEVEGKGSELEGEKGVAFKQSVDVEYMQDGECAEDNNRDNEEVKRKNKKVESMKKTDALREHAEVKKKMKKKDKKVELTEVKKKDKKVEITEVTKKMKKKDKKVEITEVKKKMKRKDKKVEGDDKEEEIGGVKMEMDDEVPADLVNTNSEEGGIKTIEKLTDEAWEMAKELENMLVNRKCKTKIPVIRITHVSQVRTVYLLKKMFNIELDCSFRQGNSSRLAMGNAIKDEASKMGVTLII